MADHKIKRRKPSLSWHQKQLRKVAVVLAIIGILLTAVLMWLLNRSGPAH